MAVADHQAPTHPGLLLRDSVLPDLHLSVSQAARDLAVTRQTLHRILSGNAAITAEMAARLERFCGLASEFWLERQYRHELHRVKAQLAPILSHIPFHPLSAATMQQIGGRGAL